MTRCWSWWAVAYETKSQNMEPHFLMAKSPLQLRVPISQRAWFGNMMVAPTWWFSSKTRRHPETGILYIVPFAPGSIQYMYCLVRFLFSMRNNPRSWLLSLLQLPCTKGNNVSSLASLWAEEFLLASWGWLRVPTSMLAKRQGSLLERNPSSRQRNVWCLSFLGAYLFFLYCRYFVLSFACFSILDDWVRLLVIISRCFLPSYFLMDRLSCEFLATVAFLDFMLPFFLSLLARLANFFLDGSSFLVAGSWRRLLSLTCW